MSPESKQSADEMRPEYDIRGGERGKYYERYRKGVQAAIVSPEGVESKPRAFVVMPFGEGFDEIYNLFIAGAIAEAGYEIFRADDVRSHQNILKDIVTSIFQSELIVADLTTANPNVYYELGLAHAFRKRVILLTQQINELPFDLRSYRVIPYSTHFAEIAKARTQLRDLARDALTRTIPFGSPVIDFLPNAPLGTLPSGADDIKPAMTTEGEAGLLDHLVGLEEGFGKLGEIVVGVNAETEAVGQATAEVAGQLQILAAGPARDRREVVIGLARSLAAYASSLSRHNDVYAATLSETRTSLEFVIRAQSISNENEALQVRGFLSQMDAAEAAAHQARVALGELVEGIRSVPRIERTFSRASDDAVRELERYVQNIDQTIAMIVRARDVARARLPA